MRNLEELANDYGPTIEQTLLQALKGLRYGSVEILIHDSKIVQIERKERFRFTTPSHPAH